MTDKVKKAPRIKLTPEEIKERKKQYDTKYQKERRERDPEYLQYCRDKAYKYLDKTKPDRVKKQRYGERDKSKISES